MANINGTSGNDVAWGTHGCDVIAGGEGNDILKGHGGHDVIDGGAGDDWVLGGSGNDWLSGGAGDDWVLGGTGHDVLVYRAAENAGDCDVYLGGRGCDTLVLVLPPALASDAALMAEIDAFHATPSHHVFTFHSLGLTVHSLERLVVHVPEPETRAPEAGDDALFVTQNEAGTIDLTRNDADPDETSLSVETIDATGLVGQLTDNGDGTVSYDPAGAFDALPAGETAVQTFTYTVRDGNGETATATVTITVEGTNDAPVVAAVDLGETAEDTALTLSAADLVDATDVDGDEPSLAEVSLNGTVLEADANGDYTIVPPADFNGTLVLDVAVTDGTATVQTTATLTVTAVNDGPVAADVAPRTVAEDGALTYSFDDLLAGATDADGDVLTIAGARGTNGTATVDADARTVTFRPDADFNGAASFAFAVSDGTASDTGRAAVTVTAVNDGPVAADVAPRTVAEDGSLAYSFDELLAGASDADGDTLTITDAQGTNGTAIVDAVARTVTFTPDADFSGAASFAFTVSDGTASDAATAAITVTPVNDAPVAPQGTLVLEASDEDAPRGVPYSALLEGVSDADGDRLTVEAVTASTTPATLGLSGVIFRPAADDDSEVTFTVRIGDGQGGTVTRTATFDLAAVNDAPVVRDVRPDRTVNEDGSTTYSFAGLLSFASDVDGDELTITGVEGTNGTATIDEAARTVTFRPDADFNGEAGFSFTVSDGALEDTARATIDVRPVNDAPTGAATIALPGGQEDTSVDISTAQLLAGARDVEDDALSIENLRVSDGYILDNEDGTYTYDPLSNDNGTVTFTYDVSDGAASFERTATLDLAAVNDAPTIGLDTPEFTEFSANGQNFTRITYAFVASDVDGDPVTLAFAPDGALAINGGGQAPAVFNPVFDPAAGTLIVTYSSDSNFDATFTMRASDGQGGFDDVSTWFLRGDIVDLADGTPRPDRERTQIVEGTEGADIVGSNSARVIVYGNGGDDQVRASSEGDVVYGGAGNDTINTARGDDEVYGGAGDDIVDASYGADALYGGDGNDTLEGSWDDDALYGGDGDDLLDGGHDDDVLYGGGGNDTLDGGQDADALYGGDGNDVLDGGNAADFLDGGDGSDILDGGNDADTFCIQGDRGYSGVDQIVDYEPGIDTVQLDIFRPNGEIVPLTRGEVLATETFDGSVYTYSFGDTSFTTQTALQAGDIEIV